MSSDVEICNLALQKLGAARITSLTEDSRNARSCNTAYGPMRDRELRTHVWNFARKRVVLAPDATAPVFDFLYAFSIPSDSLRVLPPNDNDLDWQIEGGKILTNTVRTISGGSAALNLVYIAQITDANAMDAAFRDALACKIAEQICEEITQSSDKKQAAVDGYKRAISDAKLANAIEQISADPPTDTWDTARL